MNPACTVKASQVDRGRDSSSLARQASATKASKAAAKRFRKAQRVAADGEQPCPMKAVLEAAVAGDDRALVRVESLYGKRWRDLL